MVLRLFRKHGLENLLSILWHSLKCMGIGLYIIVSVDVLIVVVVLLFCLKSNICFQVKTTYYNSFESVTGKTVTADGAILFTNVYRNDYSEKHPYTANYFNNEFTEFLAELLTLGYPLTLVCDYNFHIESTLSTYVCTLETNSEIKKKREAYSFLHILKDDGFHQIVDKATHDLSGILDLIIVEDPTSIVHWEVIHNGYVCVSDHNAIVYDMKLNPLVSSSKITLNYRELRKLDVTLFAQDLQAKNINGLMNSLDVNESVKAYDDTLGALLDKKNAQLLRK